ncbi:MAG: S46 family peptidase, partial [Acidobacteria bacterium]|nr:S46 family peptidase [Acidobacteriota bacterium]
MKNYPFYGILLAFASLGIADDGIWLLNEFPRSAIKAKYGFDVSDGFLKNLQLGSVRFNNGGSGSFVSGDGLVFTNHHVGSDCIQKLSSKEHDYLKDGFIAASRSEERKCPDLELNVLLSIENVTEKVKASVPATANPAEAASRRRAEMSAIEKACSDRTNHRCDVVTLFS